LQRERPHTHNIFIVEEGDVMRFVIEVEETAMDLGAEEIEVMPWLLFIWLGSSSSLNNVDLD
jgi:hypothetical protein